MQYLEPLLIFITFYSLYLSINIHSKIGGRDAGTKRMARTLQGISTQVNDVVIFPYTAFILYNGSE